MDSQTKSSMHLFHLLNLNYDVIFWWHRIKHFFSYTFENKTCVLQNLQLPINSRCRSVLNTL